MSTTVGLNDQDEDLLDRLAPTFGSRSGAVSEALRFLAADIERRELLEAFREAFDKAWTADRGPIDPTAVDDMIDHFARLNPVDPA